jgi:sarcosine oxidase subunit beta
MQHALPDDAGVVVIGGGAIGCSIAMHLAGAGVPKVVLLDAGELGAGSTCKGAGGVRSSFSTPTNLLMGLRGLDVYLRFPDLYGQHIDFVPRGYLYCLADDDSYQAFEQCSELQRHHGISSRMVSAEEAKSLSPLISTEGLVGAMWSQNDAICAPDSVTMGYAAAASRAGATLVTHTAVTDIPTSGGAITSVRTTRGAIRTAAVVCAAGAWSAAIGDMVGQPLPVSPYRRQIAFTEAIDPSARDSPMTIDFPSTLYFHPEGAGLLFGWSDPDEPAGFDTSFRLDGWIDKVAGHAAVRIPTLLDLGVVGGWAGLYEVTPDHNQIIGRSRLVEGFYYATGFSGHGFQMAPATGEIIRNLFLGREPTYPVEELAVDRFAPGALAAHERNII